jgi:hypothetical protein
MERLITILMFFMGCIGLFGQNAPMVVAGKVHVSGPVYSQGAVHVYASVDTGKIDIANTSSNAMLKTDTIILYSNDTYDGLLKNMNLLGGGVKGITSASYPQKVIVRKTFTADVWTYFSLPFDVVQANIKRGNTNTTYTGGGSTDIAYWVYEFDAEKRADSSSVAAGDTWKEINYTNGLAKSTGYQLWYSDGFATSGVLDFVTTQSTDIDTIFNTYDKPRNFGVYASDGWWVNPEYGDGWAFIGGLNSTSYTIKRGTIGDYTGVVYYRDSRNSQSTGTQLSTGYEEVSLAGLSPDEVTLGPYTPFYIQDVTTNNNPGTWATSTFTFKGVSGLSLESTRFRSANDENSIKDQLYFALSSNKDDSFDRLYLNFTNGYGESFRAVEDGMKMSRFDGKPTVWSLDETNKELFVNGLPMKDDRDVKIGFSVPEAGDYTISLDALLQQDVRNAVLVDNVANKKVNLLQTSYSFNTGVVESNNDRFVLLINSSYTDIPLVETDAPYAYVKDNLLTIKNLLEGDRIQVWDLAGRMIVSAKVSGKEFSTVLIQKGIYVVSVKGAKTSILKVLNR